MSNSSLYCYIWDAYTGSLLLNTTFSDCHIIDISPNCHQLLLKYPNDPHNVSIIDVGSGTILHQFTLSENYVDSVVWSPDGSMVAAGSSDGIIKVWNADTGELLQTFMTAKDRRLHV